MENNFTSCASCCNLTRAIIVSSSIGYPLVYMGFDATCYFSSMFKLRTQKSAHSENDLHMDLLQQSLPPYMHLYPKLWMEGIVYFTVLYNILIHNNYT